MVDYKACATPYKSGVKLTKYHESPHVDITLYNQLVRSLIDLTHSRTGIFFVVIVVSLFMQDPGEIHWKDAKCIAFYLKGTSHLVWSIVEAPTHWLTTSTLIGMMMVMIKNKLLFIFFISVMDPWSGPLRNKSLSLCLWLN